MEHLRKLSKTQIILFLIVVVAFILRFFAFDKVPASMVPDEVALGYTSFSLLKTGADIHGNFMPIALTVFGSAWTLITYPLMIIISQLLFGLNEFSVKFPSAFSGVMEVVLIYFIAKNLFKSNRIGIFASLTFALSPWAVYFSRMAYEMNLALVSFLGGFLCLVKFLEGSNRKSLLLIISVLLFSLTLFTYYSYVIFIPLFSVAVLFFYRKSFLKDKRFPLAVGILIFFVALIFIIISKTSINEAGTQGIFNDRNTIYQRVEKFRNDNSGEPVFWQSLVHTRYVGVTYQFALNYLNTFSTGFLFETGGDKITNDIGYFGKFYPLDALFLIVGFVMLFYKKEKYVWLVASWLFLAPIASAITKDAPSTTRLLVLLPIFILIIAYGMNQIFVYFWNRKFGKLAVFLLATFMLFNYVLFIDAYFVHFNYQRVRFFNYGFKQAVEISQRYPDYKIVMKGPDNFPYIYFLFYTKYDPKKFISQVQYYPATSEGFVFVRSFGRYSFPYDINYQKLEPKTIYFDFYSPGEKTKTQKEIYLPSGEPFLIYNINN